MCAIFGTESGGSKNALKVIVKKFNDQAKGAFEIGDIQAGNDVAKTPEEVAALKEKFDVILVVTSSYGEGEPPDNILEFFTAIMSLAGKGEKPLAGMQHAVMGFGSSVYDTFQNCPRLVDKYLGESGSRRMAMRAELDECHESDLKEVDQPSYHKWVKEVFDALTALPKADSKDACEWNKPEGKVQLVAGREANGSAGGMLFMGLLVTGVAAAALYQMFMTGETA